MLVILHLELPLDHRPILLGNVYNINLYIYQFALNNEKFFSAAATNPKASATYGILYINFFLKVALELQSHICKPSKRNRTIPVPVAPVSFSSRCIQGYQNQAAATILFTSWSHATTKQHHGSLPARKINRMQWMKRTRTLRQEGTGIGKKKKKKKKNQVSPFFSANFAGLTNLCNQACIQI